LYRTWKTDDRVQVRVRNVRPYQGTVKFQFDPEDEFATGTQGSGRHSRSDEDEVMVSGFAPSPEQEQLVSKLTA